ncbi:MAG TPA: hypothetical protein VIO84_14420, partial [Candidatus Dormibacteraeota bacterium]
MTDENDQFDMPAVMRDRREKLQRLRESGVEPYARSFERTHTTAEARALLGDGVGQERTPPVRLP